MSETIHSFGSDLGKVGILSRPQAAAKTVILMWNVGMSHRIGPQRQFVDLCRLLGSDDIHTFRFDLSGLGDSRARKDGLAGELSDEADVSEALDFLEQMGYQNFILVGFCSSAAVAHAVAVTDARVKGMVLLEFHAYKTALFRVIYLLRRLWRPIFYQTFLQRQRERWRERKWQQEASYFRRSPERGRVAREVQSLVDRGTLLYYIYSGGMIHLYNHRSQFFRMFPGLDGKGCIEVDYFRGSDHLHTPLECRHRTLAAVQDWLRIHFAAE